MTLTAAIVIGLLVGISFQLSRIAEAVENQEDDDGAPEPASDAGHEEGE